ncbi:MULTISPECIES: undecaprenyldiphospho-muramoylpentapeptide beta-N-acetylglucosaminyltransferase [Kamptonema]|uniref:undecaprenyldiphospho-muramoylpentapeptide beta-N-acetylglucosaminyltransferase n=1 Tax=Kamptonema TaxID=1501433 RepID=UPI0001DAC7CE|nr:MULTISPECIES: undecaprenyldiphospho-muramoylpentapeptide beta-N-acetylglucosaminyltransferase [Kamptonema]CBN54379.1 UDP-N-acetylglucosamine--N-acetylmuramyl-(pentapeptide) pyrophosphoryl-undecaprenol N-acetylglucosamine transferase [Kamptonema sp. PCC 6506]
MTNTQIRLLIAASGTGGHLFPAIATAEQLSDYQIEWLGVPDRMETELIPPLYPLHTIPVEGFQGRFGLGTARILGRLASSILEVRNLLKQGNFQGVFTTGGYIAAPAILAARSLGLPVILHESNALPGKVTRWFGPWCTKVAIGFEAAAQYLPRAKTVYAGTPVRSQFLTPQPLDLPIAENVPLIVAMGGSQGAVGINQLVRQCAPAWFNAGATIVHLTGNNDPDADTLKHPQYFSLPFYNNMGGLLQRANLAISRSGASALTELAVTGTPAILIPYPYAAEDHQSFNAAVFTKIGAALSFRQSELNAEVLETKVLNLLADSEHLAKMSAAVYKLAVNDSATRLANLVRELLNR